MRSNLEILLNDLLVEAISPETEEQIKNLKPSDVVTVYHGTSLSRLPELINGFDATTVRKRDYGGPQHRGLFVTPDFETAKSFGDGTILELKVYAKFIHGTNWSGVIGREEQKQKGKDALDWVKEKFPNSFRPWMSYTMLSSGAEPQGLLLGVVKPSQITRIWTYNRQTNEYTEHTRDELARSGKAYNATWRGGKSEEKNLFDAGVDLSNPKLKLEDFLDALAKYEEGDPARYLKMLLFMAKLGEDRLKDKLQYIEIGGSSLGRLALNNIVRQLMARIDESQMPVESLLSFLLEGHTKTDEVFHKVLEDWVERGIEAKPGLHWFPPKELFKYREYMRPTRPDLQKSMGEQGFDPKHPLQVSFGRDGHIKVGEGNHRLKTAIQLGLDKIPVEFFFVGSAMKMPLAKDIAQMKRDKDIARKKSMEAERTAFDRKYGIDKAIEADKKKEQERWDALTPEERAKETAEKEKTVDDIMQLLGF